MVSRRLPKGGLRPRRRLARRLAFGGLPRGVHRRAGLCQRHHDGVLADRFERPPIENADPPAQLPRADPRPLFPRVHPARDPAVPHRRRPASRAFLQTGAVRCVSTFKGRAGHARLGDASGRLQRRLRVGEPHDVSGGLGRRRGPRDYRWPRLSPTVLRLASQHLRNVLRRFVGARRRGAESGGHAGRVLPQHRRGRHLPLPPHRRRRRLEHRHGLLCLWRERRDSRRAAVSCRPV
mmetsp:Transcript_32347/g.108992  ORF Transcript_32347/g.108992 Transcript_32347/m.108992 type:complete len:236 (-) Transcript_32347:501-1208(-)